MTPPYSFSGKDSGLADFRKRVRNLTRLARLDTQKIRGNSIKSLEKLAKLAHGFATSAEESPSSRRNWARLEAYIQQTMNGIVHEYDVVQIREKLDELRRLVDVELGKSEQEKKETTASR